MTESGMENSRKDSGQSRIAVVTGSSSGIGRAIALKLADQGFNVIVHAGKNREKADQVVEEVTEKGRQSISVVEDFSSQDNLNAFVDNCWNWRGKVDVWINNAGADVLTGDAGDWDFATKLNAVLQVDVVATLLLSRDIADRMREAFELDQCRRSIVNIGWDQANHGMAGDSGEMFAASKGAVMACTKSLAQSFAPAVRVNCIAPGWIQTSWGQKASSRWQERAQQESLLNRWGTPEDIAAVAGFLASGESEFVNGQVICANGGFAFSRDSFTDLTE